MSQSLSDRLLLALDRRLRPDHGPSARQAAAALPKPGEAGQRHEQPAAEPFGAGQNLVWLAASDPQSVPALNAAISHLGAQFPDYDFIVTPSDALAGPGHGAAEIAAFLDLVQPVAAILTGSIFAPALVAELTLRQIPILGAMLRMPQDDWLEKRLARPLARRYLSRFQRLLAEDELSLTALRRLGASDERLSLGGVLSDPVAVPRGNTSELESLTELMRGRPVWCAASLPLSEVATIAEAQSQAHRRSHRLLLVVVPEQNSDAPLIAEQLTNAGMICGIRSEGDDPIDDFSAYVADLDGEIGLWLRLAPVTFIGGTLTSSSASRSPIEAAALGSAVVHGAQIAPFASAYGRLAAAGAAKLVTDAGSLADQIDMLIQPANAAIMAHAGWEVASAGDEAAEALAQALAPILESLNTA